MVFRPAGRVRHNALEHLGDTLGYNLQSGLLQNFTADSGLQGLTRFQHASGQRPITFQRLATALREKYPIMIEDKRAYSENRPFWISPANKETLP
jgi:hypothetical protein